MIKVTILTRGHRLAPIVCGSSQPSLAARPTTIACPLIQWNCGDDDDNSCCWPLLWASACEAGPGSALWLQLLLPPLLPLLLLLYLLLMLLLLLASWADWTLPGSLASIVCDRAVYDAWAAYRRMMRLCCMMVHDVAGCVLCYSAWLSRANTLCLPRDYSSLSRVISQKICSLGTRTKAFRSHGGLPVLYYLEGMKARVSPVQSIEDQRILASTETWTREFQVNSPEWIGGSPVRYPTPPTSWLIALDKLITLWRPRSPSSKIVTS